jgi:hypothetical protein
VGALNAHPMKNYFVKTVDEEIIRKMKYVLQVALEA